MGTSKQRAHNGSTASLEPCIVNTAWSRYLPDNLSLSTGPCGPPRPATGFALLEKAGPGPQPGPGMGCRTSRLRYDATTSEHHIPIVPSPVVVASTLQAVSQESSHPADNYHMANRVSRHPAHNVSARSSPQRMMTPATSVGSMRASTAA